MLGHDFGRPLWPTLQLLGDGLCLHVYGNLPGGGVYHPGCFRWEGRIGDGQSLFQDFSLRRKYHKWTYP